MENGKSQDVLRREAPFSPDIGENMKGGGKLQTNFELMDSNRILKRRREPG